MDSFYQFLIKSLSFLKNIKLKTQKIKAFQMKIYNMIFQKIMQLNYLGHLVRFLKSNQ